MNGVEVVVVAMEGSLRVYADVGLRLSQKGKSCESFLLRGPSISSEPYISPLSSHLIVHQAAASNSTSCLLVICPRVGFVRVNSSIC